MQNNFVTLNQESMLRSTSNEIEIIE